MQNKPKMGFTPYQHCGSGFTLIEFVVAIFLLSMVVLTAVTLELSLRKLQAKPEIQVKLLDELVPVVERIKKDFEGQIGVLYNTSLEIQDSGRRLAIRVDSNNDGKITSSDAWHAYRWNGTVGNPIEYSPINFTVLTGYEVLAQGITDFSVTAPTTYNNTALTLTIRTKKNPSAVEDLFTNPAVNLTTTVYSRMTSGR